MLSFDQTDDEFVDELADYVALPSISRYADPSTMQAAAQ